MGENNWLVPPIFLIPKVLNHLVASGGRGTLIVPTWPSAPFWPLIFTDEGLSPMFSDFFEIPMGTDVFLLGNYFFWLTKFPFRSPVFEVSWLELYFALLFHHLVRHYRGCTWIPYYGPLGLVLLVGSTWILNSSFFLRRALCFGPTRSYIFACLLSFCVYIYIHIFVWIYENRVKH